MDCLIEVERAPGRLIVRVVGRFTQEQVPDFLEACATGGTPIDVDLTDLVSVDAVGLEALRRARVGGASLTHLPRYLEPMLEA